MNIFFDEDTGGGVPAALRALRLSNINIEWPRPEPSAPVKKGARDEDWIPWVGRHNYLVFSCNTGIWEAEAQRQLCLDHRAGVVFLSTGQGRKLDVMRLVLNQWDWLIGIWLSQDRPFAWRITITGTKTLIHPPQTA